MIEAPSRPRRLTRRDSSPISNGVAIMLALGLACTACASPRFSDRAEAVQSGSADAAAPAPPGSLGGSDAATLAPGDSGALRDAGDALAGDAPKSEFVDAGATPAHPAPSEVDGGNSAIVQPTPPVIEPPATGECPAKAVFAVQYEIGLKWQGRNIAGFVPLVRAGMGTATVWARVAFDESAGRTQALITGCGTTVPDLAAGGSFGAEQYGFHFADSMWDRPGMPRWTLGWNRKCKTPGCALESDVAIWTLGASVTADAPVGLGALDRIQSADQDGDGYEGLSLTIRTPSERTASGGHYSYVPLSITGAGPRTGTLFTAIQIGGQFYGNLEGCDGLAGVVRGVSLEMRTIGCLAHEGANASETTVCSLEQARAIEENMPVFVSVTEARFEGRRVADTADCAAVRQVWK
jgi:hypothetical protein